MADSGFQRSVNTTVRSYLGSGPNIACVWDGKDGSGVVQPDGVYTMAITAAVGTGSASASTTVTLDTTPPTVALSVPAPGLVLSNVYQSPSVSATGTVTDANLSNWTLDWGVGSAPTTWTTISTGTSQVSNGTFGVWSWSALANGPYTVRVQGLDRAGNRSLVANAVTVGNFFASQNVLLRCQVRQT